MKKNVYFYHIFDLNLKISYHIVSLFGMYIYMGDKIAGEQDRPSLIIDDPFRAPIKAQNITFNILAHVWKTAFQIISHYCTYASIVMRAAFADILVPLIPLDFM